MSTVLNGIGALYTCPVGAQHEVGCVEQAALVWERGRITWVGPERELPAVPGARRLHAGGRAVLPGLIDCHTHLAFGGWRADEFAARIEGRSYLDIAAAGGGIASTVRATRASSTEALAERAVAVLDEVLALGVTTLECKSGYGLSTQDELRLLEVYAAIKHPVQLVPTLLGAHVVPAEHKADPERYVQEVITRMLPEVAARGLASACDVFVERGAFTVEQARRILGAARALGMAVRVHADQLSDGGGAALAAEFGALSADHLEYTRDEDLRALAAAGVVAVSLPLASLYTFQPPLDARRAVAAGAMVAVASDFNPGTAPSAHLPLAMLLGCTLNRLTPRQALKAATRVAARAVGLEASHGGLEVGMVADLVVVDAPTVEHWLYQFRGGPAVGVVKGGEVVSGGLA